ncbi:hypothetical protein, partial [Nocardia carnea]|uniref:hypothetical protein n=1 Tax=Nocardia carnea TaxID=37328 RepID=UPI002453FD7D
FCPPLLPRPRTTPCPAIQDSLSGFALCWAHINVGAPVRSVYPAARAAALLSLRAGRRLWKRSHGERDPADKGVDPGVRRRVIRLGRARRRKSGHAEFQVSDEARETGHRSAHRRERV